MSKEIVLTRGDDTDVFENIFLVVHFKTKRNLDGYTASLTIENPHNVMRKYEVIDNAFKVDFDKITTSTLGVGVHKANIKLYDTLNKIKTVYNFTINVQDEFETNIPVKNEHEIEIILEPDGISKYKDYNELLKKPSINNVILEGNKTFEDIGVTFEANKIATELIKQHNTNPESHKHLQDQIYNKQDKLIAGANITIIDGIISSLGSEGGVTTDYKHLGNKPKINNIVLDNNLSLDELGIQPKGEYITEDVLNNKGFLTSVPSGYITEEELEAEKFLKEVPPEYYTDAQNQEVYATIGELELKQDKLTAGENISIVEDLDNGITTISAQIPENYVTEEELSNLNFSTEDKIRELLNEKQNNLRAGDNIRLYRNIDGTYTISAIDSKNPKDIVSYNGLANKPFINGIELVGSKSLSDLGIQPAGEYQNKLMAGENIIIENNTIKAYIPEHICTDAELQQGLSTKADKSTTLLGYGILDSYTKEEVDNNIKNNIDSKVTDIIISAPNGVASYTETTLTAQSGLTVAFSNGLTSDNLYKNIIHTLDNDITIDISSLEYNELYKTFYLMLLHKNNVTSLIITPKVLYNHIISEVIPNDLAGFVKNVNENKTYEMLVQDVDTYYPSQVYLKIIGEGSIIKNEQEFIKISSFTPYSAYRILNKDEMLLQIKDFQTKFEVGEGFTFKNNKLEYEIPFNYVTKEFLIENSFATQVNINDAISNHNIDTLSHHDIRTKVNNIEKTIPNLVTNEKLTSELQPYALITDVPDGRDFCTREEYDSLLQRINTLENLVNQLTNK